MQALDYSLKKRWRKMAESTPYNRPTPSPVTEPAKYADNVLLDQLLQTVKEESQMGKQEHLKWQPTFPLGQSQNFYQDLELAKMFVELQMAIVRLPEYQKLQTRIQLIQQEQITQAQCTLNQIPFKEFATEEPTRSNSVSQEVPPTALQAPTEPVKETNDRAADFVVNIVAKKPKTDIEPQIDETPQFDKPSAIRKKRQQYRRYDQATLSEAIKAVQSGEMSVHRAGSHFGVPHSTLEYKVKNRHLLYKLKKEQQQQQQSLLNEQLSELANRPTTEALDIPNAEMTQQLDLHKSDADNTDNSIGLTCA